MNRIQFSHLNGYQQFIITKSLLPQIQLLESELSNISFLIFVIIVRHHCR